MSRFYWGEDTVNHFKFESAYLPKKMVRTNVLKFVKIDCTWEEGETEEDLVNDLMKKIYE